MTTPEQLLVDPKWRRHHSIYTLWALFFGFGFVSFLYTGIRAKKSKWTIWGAIYGVVVIGAISIGGSLSPEDPDAATPLGANIAYTMLMIAWVVSAIHVFRERKEWLRWKAEHSGQPRWFEPSTPTTPAPEADLSGLDIADPSREYLAPPPPDPPLRPARAPGSAPPPPVDPPSKRATDLPPPPTAPPSRSQPLAAASSHQQGEPERVDLNTASIDALAALPGVGIATARRIAEKRKQQGGFESVDEAAIAVGVQPHVRARLQQLATVSERKPRETGRSTGRIVDI